MNLIKKIKIKIFFANFFVERRNKIGKEHLSKYELFFDNSLFNKSKVL